MSIIVEGCTVKLAKDSRGNTFPSTFLGMEGTVISTEVNTNNEELTILKVQFQFNPNEPLAEPLEFFVYANDCEVMEGGKSLRNPDCEYSVEYKKEEMSSEDRTKYTDTMKSREKIKQLMNDFEKNGLVHKDSRKVKIVELLKEDYADHRRIIKELNKNQTDLKKYFKAKRIVKGSEVVAQIQLDENRERLTTAALKSRLQYQLNAIIRKNRLDFRDSINNPTECGFNFLKQGNVYLEEGQLKEYVKHLKNNAIQQQKKVVKDTNYIGIEIEFNSPIRRGRLEKMMAKKGLGKWIQLTTDGSLRPDVGDDGIEIRILVQQHEKDYVLRKLGKVLKDIDATVNHKCGLHVHLDMRNRDVNQSYINLFNAQKFLVDSQPSDRRDSEYCRNNIDGEFKTSGSTNRHARYNVINCQAYTKFKTLEIRSHEGCVDADSIINWVDFLLSIVDNNKLSNKYKELDSLNKKINIPENAYKYISDRMEKYAS